MDMQMSGKVCVVTGASSGIGRATAVGLAKLGATVVPVMRSASPRVESALSGMKAAQSGGGAPISAMYADLSSQDSIRQFAAKFNSNFERLDVLINNAGVNCSKRKLTVDGLETTFAVNVLAPFLLTSLLLEKLKSSEPSRIVNVSSDAAKGQRVDFENLQGEKRYSMLRSYGASKLELNLLTVELARRLKGTRVTANFLHPGVIKTNLARGMNPAAQAVFSFVKLFFASPEKGARTSIYLASSPEVEGVSGKFFSKEREAEAPAESYDLDVATRLWQKCEELTRVKPLA
jgi:NAD(P)-dependent dehydrogenase (short-subunit alcohol dehydrogenase family)